jgi:hypothetical protein
VTDETRAQERLQLSRENDDVMEIPNVGPVNVLRASIGGTEEIGYYLKFRGDPADVVKMLELATEAAKERLPLGRYDDRRT